MYQLRQALDFFRDQALQLEAKYEVAKREKLQWKAKAEGLESDVKFLEQMVSKL